jgi:hypothetical protein
VSNAARAGAQVAISRNAYGVPATIQTAATADAGNIPVAVASSYFCQCPDGSSNTPSCAPAPPVCATGNFQAWVTVTTSYTFKTVIKYPGVPNSTPLTSTAQMRIQ